MEEDKKFKVVVSIAFLVIASFMGWHYANRDIGNYDYCVEWDGWIHRDNMVFNCYDFENLKLKCHYTIEDNGTLIVTNYVPDNVGEDEINNYHCSKWVKSISGRDR